LHGRAAVPDWRILLDYHFGGYARRHPDLDAFVAGFMASTGLMIEPVYTGRLFAAIYDQVVRGEIGRGERIIALHTGGICNK
jgi:1-aminocyclopropane-1-carboxylate deaminase